MKNNILLCYHAAGGLSHYYDFAEELVKNGNNVLLWNFCLNKIDNKNRKEIFEKISDFKPNLIFSYNNLCPEEIIKKFQIPVLLLDADNPEFFHNKEIINKNNFYFLGFQSNSKELYQKILGANITPNNYISFPSATGFKKDSSIKQDINISFIGSCFYGDYLEGRILSLEEKKQMISLAQNLKKNYYFQDSNIDPTLLRITKSYLTGQIRLKYLSTITDLGLQIFSNADLRSLLTYDFDIANCFNDKIVLTKEENQNLYNRSKISLNLSHIQATNSFSWRVTEIMASNSCLLTEDKPDWHNLFGEYISDSVKKTIIYKNQYDLREKCVRLLSDEDLRLRCVEECQNAIEKNGRWNNRIQKIEQLLNIKIINNLNNSGKLEDISKIPQEVILRSSILHPKKKNRTSLGIFMRCFVIMLYCLPIIGNKIIKRKRIVSIVDTILAK